METLVCWRCKEAKDKSEFYKSSQRKRGFSYRCKPCDNALSKEWRQKNPKLSSELALKWKRENRDAARTLNARSKIKRRESYNKLQRARAKAIRQATPSWLTDEQLAEIAKTYEAARILKDVTGMKYEVDHMHAISGKDYCGLNVPWNLQIVTAAANAAKGRHLPEFHSHLAWGG